MPFITIFYFTLQKKELTTSLKDTAISGAKWNGAFHIGKYLITFFLSIILARLLTPDEFGLLGMLTIITVIAQVFIDSGLSVAIIRLKEVKEVDYSTVFFFNIIISTTFYAMIFFIAPFVSNFYNEPQLTDLTRIISLVFLINALGLVQNAILVRNLNFKKQSLCNITGVFISAIIAAIMAIKGFGVYSIVGQAITQASITNILLWVTSKWRPQLIFSCVSFKKLWSFGSKVLGVNIVTQIVDNIDNLIIGKVFSATQLGFYMRAKSSKQMPEQIFTNILNTTVFPVLTKVSDDDSEFRRLHLQFFKLSCFLFLPIVLGFAAVAESFTVVLFTEKWLISVPILQIIVLGSFPYFLGALFMQTIMAKGKGQLYFKLNTAKKVLTLISIPFAIFFGVYPFIISLTIISFINLFLDFWHTGKMLNIPFSFYIKLILPSFVLSVIMATIVFLIKFLPIDYPIITFGLQLIIGVLTYAIFATLQKNEEYYYILSIIKEQINRIRHTFQ